MESREEVSVSMINPQTIDLYLISQSLQSKQLFYLKTMNLASSVSAGRISARLPTCRLSPQNFSARPFQQRKVDLTQVVSAKSFSGIKSSVAMGAAESGSVQGDMLEPSVANNVYVRVASIAAVVAVSAKATGFLTLKAIGFIHAMAFGTWFGTLAWTSFVFGIVAFRNLPRQTFGKLQSKLFPKYFVVTGFAPAFMMATLYYLTGGAPPMHEMRLLGISALTAVLNLVVAEPAATDVMFKRYALENAEGERDEESIKALKKQFGKWHGISSLLNLVNLVCAVGHAFYLGGSIAFV
jgi:hypothetical protein